MTLATRIPTATFPTSLRGLRLPNRRKLVAEYVLGVSQAESVKNRANPALPLTVQGVPTYNASSVTVRSSVSAGYGFLTGLIPNDDATLIIVRKPASIATTTVIAGMASPYWIGFRQFGATNYGSNGEPANNQGANRATPGAGTIFFEALVLSRENPQLVSGGYGKLYHYGGGSQVEVVSANKNVTGRSTMYGQQIAIGSNTLTDVGAAVTCDVYFFALYQRTLSPAEIDEAYDAIVAYYATRGVTVV